MFKPIIEAVILNPQCRGGAGYKVWKDLLQSDWGKECRLSQVPTFDGAGISEPAELQKSLRVWVGNQIELGRKNFVIAGGDGTVHLAVNSLQGLGIRLGAIGLGSSNDFHKPFQSAGRTRIEGVPCRLDFESAFHHDLGEVLLHPVDENEEPSKRVLFVINASLGLTAQANYFFNSNSIGLKGLKCVSVKTAILFAAIREFVRFRSLPVELEFEDGSKKEVSLTNLGIVKNPHFAGDFRYDEPQAPTDGCFGVHLCEEVSKAQLLKVFFGLMRGKFRGLPGTSSFQCSQLRVSGLNPFVIETDGEVRESLQASFRVLPGEILLCP